MAARETYVWKNDLRVCFRVFTWGKPAGPAVQADASDFGLVAPCDLTSAGWPPTGIPSNPVAVPWLPHGEAPAWETPHTTADGLTLC